MIRPAIDRFVLMPRHPHFVPFHPIIDLVWRLAFLCIFLVLRAYSNTLHVCGVSLSPLAFSSQLSHFSRLVTATDHNYLLYWSGGVEPVDGVYNVSAIDFISGSIALFLDYGGFAKLCDEIGVNGSRPADHD